jgi:cytochrome c-type biogenesis protein CcmH
MNAAGTLRRARAGLPRLLLPIALAAGLATLIIVAAGGHPPASRAQEVQQIAAGLHCPICKDLSVADSPAPLAQQMRQEIAQKVRAGQSQDQIRAGFVAAYGDSVLMSPPRQGVAAVVYYVPVLILVAGLITAFLLLRRWLRATRPDLRQAGPPQAGSAQAGPPQAGPPPLSAAQRRAVARAVARLREEEP